MIGDSIETSIRFMTDETWDNLWVFRLLDKMLGSLLRGTTRPMSFSGVESCQVAERCTSTLNPGTLPSIPSVHQTSIYEVRAFIESNP